MYNHFEIEMQSEFNAQFDSVREAYAASELDPIYEGWCSYCSYCEQEGVEPMSYEAFAARERQPNHIRYAGVVWSVNDDEIPF